jgi:hypothetical protein
MYNEKYGNTLGIIDDDFNKEQMYRIYYFIKNNCDDKDIQERLAKIKLDKPKTLEQQLTKLEGENNKDVKKYVDDNTVIHPLPIYKMDEAPTMITYTVNIMDLKKLTTYGAIRDINSTKYQRYHFIYPCDDGTNKTIVNTGDDINDTTFRVYHYDNSSTLTFNNVRYSIDYTKHSTSTDVIVTEYIQNYLGIYNTREYTPTEDYNPATKKYVDDSHPRIVNEYTIELTADELNALHADVYYGTASSYSVMVNSYNFNFNNISHVEVFVKFKGELLYIKDHCYYNNFYFRKSIETGADGEYFANIYIEEQNYKFTEGITIYLKEVSTYYSSVFNPNDVVIGNSITIGGRNYADGYGHEIGRFSAAIGSNVRAQYDGSVAIGINTAADNNYAFASGEKTTARERGSHAEGYNTVANGEHSHAEGESTSTTGKFSHAEGSGTRASGYYSHAEGENTIANGEGSHVEGKSTNDYSAPYIHVQGMYNADRNYEDAKKYAHIVGNGHYDEENKTEVKSDAYTLDWKGNGWYAGKLSQEGTPTENKDLTTKKYVDDKITSLPQFSFNEAGELVVTINGVSKIFVPKAE